MQSEHDLHENASREAAGLVLVNAGAEQPESSLSESPPAEAGELGDNVDFF
jgi:hypothetical protein